MGQILSIQILRAIAALLVAAFHIQGTLAQMGHSDALPDLMIGALGVDIFFVISGFIMVHSSGALFGSAGAPGTFMLRRIARIVPLYWAATTIFLAAALFSSRAPVEGSYSAGQIFASYLFLPHPRPDGAVLPIHPLGWTLNYEMFFYALFAAAVAAPRTVAIGFVSAALCGLVLINSLFGPLPLPFGFWFDATVIEFVFGMLLAVVYARGIRLPWPGTLALILGGIGLAFLYLPGLGSSPVPRGFGWGLPAAMIVAGASLGVPIRAPGWATKAMAALGDASYSLYLLHLVVIVTARRIWTHMGLDALVHPLLFAGVAMLGSVAAAMIVFSAFERPATRFLHNRLVRLRGAPYRSELAS